MTPVGRWCGQASSRNASSSPISSARPGWTSSALSRQRFVQAAPAGRSEIVRPGHREPFAGPVQSGQRGADPGAMKRVDAAGPHAGQKGDDCRRPAAQLAQRFAVTRPHRRRAGDAVMRQMVHQPDEKRQILARDPLLVQGQDEIAALGRQQKIRVLDPLGDALARQHLADVVQRDKGAQFIVTDFGIDSHALIRALPRGPHSAELSHKAPAVVDRGARVPWYRGAKDRLTPAARTGD